MVGRNLIQSNKLNALSHLWDVSTYYVTVVTCYPYGKRFVYLSII